MLYDDEMEVRRTAHERAHHLAVRTGIGAAGFDAAAEALTRDALAPRPATSDAPGFLRCPPSPRPDVHDPLSF